ncbi:MAG: hypothetical protein R6W78_03180 [Bacteroidales bacterium]
MCKLKISYIVGTKNTKKAFVSFAALWVKTFVGLVAWWEKNNLSQRHKEH